MIQEVKKTFATLPSYEPKNDRGVAQTWDKAFSVDPIGTVVDSYREAGPIFKIKHHGEERVAMAGVKANHFIWGDKELWDYPTSNRHFREQFSDRYLNQLEGVEYAKKRRRVTAGFKPSVIMPHTAAMGESIHREIARNKGEWIPFRLFCMRIIIKMTSRALMQVELPDGMDETMAISNKMMLKAESLGPWRHLYYLRPDRIYRRKKIFRYLNSIIEDREKNGSPGNDVLSMSLAAHPKDEPPIPRYELIHDLSQLMMAGSTTTSQMVLWNVLMTTQTPEWKEKMDAELSNWETDRFTNMKEWPCLKAACMEIERFRPPSMAFHRLTKKAFEFDGYEIPAKTWVTHLHTLGHYIDECYEDPLAFKPERFMEGSGMPDRDVHGLFGGGAHVCAGVPLARVLQPTAVGNILRYYDIEYQTPPSTEAKLDVVLAPRDDIMVKFHPKSS
ncbi:cytochrome P450 [Pelagicoccus albus]|uniref:Cytochrome P450 n=1 Tax=Pelagicoccus albus TaxID=415222 RepID=A0A7X1B905_9BACT|nr:cytochrome P450 [Pelagicoccus albus]MBC2607915.1 cytochrome P450 [Pelagicoccus albus]